MFSQLSIPFATLPTQTKTAIYGLKRLVNPEPTDAADLAKQNITAKHDRNRNDYDKQRVEVNRIRDCVVEQLNDTDATYSDDALALRLGPSDFQAATVVMKPVEVEEPEPEPVKLSKSQMRKRRKEGKKRCLPDSNVPARSENCPDVRPTVLQATPASLAPQKPEDDDGYYLELTGDYEEPIEPEKVKGKPQLNEEGMPVAVDIKLRKRPPFRPIDRNNPASLSIHNLLTQTVPMYFRGYLEETRHIPLNTESNRDYLAAQSPPKDMCFKDWLAVTLKPEQRSLIPDYLAGPTRVAPFFSGISEQELVSLLNLFTSAAPYLLQHGTPTKNLLVIYGRDLRNESNEYDSMRKQGLTPEPSDFPETKLNKLRSQYKTINKLRLLHCQQMVLRLRLVNHQRRRVMEELYDLAMKYRSAPGVEVPPEQFRKLCWEDLLNLRDQTMKMQMLINGYEAKLVFLSGRKGTRKVPMDPFVPRDKQFLNFSHDDTLSLKVPWNPNPLPRSAHDILPPENFDCMSQGGANDWKQINECLVEGCVNLLGVDAQSLRTFCEKLNFTGTLNSDCREVYRAQRFLRIAYSKIMTEVKESAVPDWLKENPFTEEEGIPEDVMRYKVLAARSKGSAKRTSPLLPLWKWMSEEIVPLGEEDMQDLAYTACSNFSDLFMVCRKSDPEYKRVLAFLKRLETVDTNGFMQRLTENVIMPCYSTMRLTASSPHTKRVMGHLGSTAWNTTLKELSDRIKVRRGYWNPTDEELPAFESIAKLIDHNPQYNLAANGMLTLAGLSASNQWGYRHQLSSADLAEVRDQRIKMKRIGDLTLSEFDAEAVVSTLEEDLLVVYPGPNDVEMSMFNQIMTIVDGHLKNNGVWVVTPSKFRVPGTLLDKLQKWELSVDYEDHTAVPTSFYKSELLQLHPTVPVEAALAPAHNEPES